MVEFKFENCTFIRSDTERIDWLNEDHQRLEEVFGAMVRNECGGDLRAIVDARMDAAGVLASQPTALERFNESASDLANESALERLRYFLSLALNGQDWLDVEPFLDALGVTRMDSKTVCPSHAADSGTPGDEKK